MWSKTLFWPTNRAVLIPNSNSPFFFLVNFLHELHDYFSVSSRPSSLGFFLLWIFRLPRQLLSVDQTALNPSPNVN